MTGYEIKAIDWVYVFFNPKICRQSVLQATVHRHLRSSELSTSRPS